jgi:hypothetical protein
MLPRPSQRFHPIGRQLYVMAFRCEHPFQGRGQRAVILDDENPGGGHIQRYISLL